MAKEKIVYSGETQGIDKVSKEFARLQKSLKNQFKQIKQYTVGFTAAAASVYGMVRAAQKYIRLATEQQQAEAKLSAVIKTTGQAAGFSSQQLIGMAGELQKITTYGDEAIIGMQAVLATFNKVSGKQFKDASKAILDLSAVLGTDLRSAAVQLGKVLQDPAKQLSALSRAGVSFDADATLKIKALVDEGALDDAQKIILKAIEEQVGGAAEALALTDAGKLQQLSNAWGDLGEKLGEVFFQGISKYLDDAIVAVQAVADWINDRILRQQVISGEIANTSEDIAKQIAFLEKEQKKLRDTLQEPVTFLKGVPSYDPKTIQAQIDANNKKILEYTKKGYEALANELPPLPVHGQTETPTDITITAVDELAEAYKKTNKYQIEQVRLARDNAKATLAITGLAEDRRDMALAVYRMYDEQYKKLLDIKELEVDIADNIGTATDASKEQLRIMKEQAKTLRTLQQGLATSAQIAGAGTPVGAAGLGAIGQFAGAAAATAEFKGTEYITPVPGIELQEGQKDIADLASDIGMLVSSWGTAASAAANYASTITNVVMQAQAQAAQQQAEAVSQRIAELQREKEVAIAAAEEAGVSSVAARQAYDTQITDLEKKKQAIIKDQQKKQLEVQKALAISQITIAAATGIANAWATGNPILAAFITKLVLGAVGTAIAMVLKAPPLAQGGIVPAQPGGGLYRLGEAGRPETVLPYDIRRRGAMMGNTTNYAITISGDTYGVDDLVERISDAVQRQRTIGIDDEL